MSAQQQDDRLFKNIYLSYFPKMKRFAQEYVISEQDAENIVQDMFAELWEKREMLANQTIRIAYLFTIIKNKCLNHLRHKTITEVTRKQFIPIWIYGHYTVTDKGNAEPVQFGRMYDELGWEFAWEMHRRRDAIRFGVYTKKSWLSHQPQGDYRSVFPIPEKVLTSNPNLEQNPNYK